MVKSLIQFFRRNLLLKAISFLFALTLWAFVAVGQPDIEVPRKVAVILVTPNNLVRVSDIVSHLEISLVGPRNVLRNVKDEEMTYEIDASKLEPGEITFKFIPSRIKGLPSGVSVTSLSPTQITIALAERAKRMVPVNIVLKGKVADGYEIVESIAEPSLVEVSGALEEVDRLKYVPTESVDVTGKRASVTKTVGLDLTGQHIDLVQQKEVEIKIEVIERNLTRKFENIPIIVIETGLKAIVKPGTLDVNLQGPEVMMKALAPNDIKLIVDASGLDPGVHLLRPRIQLPDPEVLVHYDLPEVSVTLKPGKKVQISGKKVKTP